MLNLSSLRSSCLFDRLEGVSYSVGNCSPASRLVFFEVSGFLFFPKLAIISVVLVATWSKFSIYSISIDRRG